MLNGRLASRINFLIPIGIVAVYLGLALFVLPSDAFFSGDAGVKFIKVQNLVANNFRDLAIDEPNPSLDADGQFSPLRQEFGGFYFYRRGEKVYGTYSDAFVIISSFFYALVGFEGLYLVSIVPAVGVAVLTAYLCKRSGARNSPGAAIAMAFCSPLFFYALAFWEHSIAVFFSTLSLLLIWIGLTGRKGLFFSAGASLGVAGWFRSELYLMAPVIAMAILFTRGLSTQTWRRVVLLVLGVAIVWLPLGGFNYVSTGTLLGAHTSLNLTKVAAHTRELRGNSYIQRQLDVLEQLLIPTGRRKWALVLLAVAGTNLFFWAYNRRKRHAQVSGWLIGVVLLCIGAVLISVSHLIQGVTPWSFTDVFPLAFLALYGLLTRRGEEHRRIISFFGWIVGPFALLVTILAPSAGGMRWGPRLLLPLYPILVLLVWHSWDQLRAQAFGHPSKNSSGDSLSHITRKVLLASFGVLVVVSFAIQVSGIDRLYQVKKGFQEINDITSQLTPPVFVTPVWWFPQSSAPVLNEIQLFGVTTTEELEQLVRLLSAAGIDRFWWVTASANAGNEAGPVHDLGLDEPLVGTYLFRRDSMSSGYFDLTYKLYEIEVADS